jgi:mRNA interferase MazF
VWHYVTEAFRLTKNGVRRHPSEAYVDVGGEQRKAMADQLATVSKRRLADRLGELSHSDLQQVARAITIQLALEP